METAFLLILLGALFTMTELLKPKPVGENGPEVFMPTIISVGPVVKVHGVWWGGQRLYPMRCDWCGTNKQADRCQGCGAKS